MSMSRLIPIATVLLAAFTAPVAGARAVEPVVRIELRPLVQVAGAEVTLGDAAAMSTTDLPLLRRLVALPLGPAPRGGEAVRLSRADLERWIRLRTGLQAGQLTWEGGEVAEVRRAQGQLPGDRV